MAKILIIDDSENLVQFLNRAFEEHGLVPLNAKDGIEGIKMAESDQPDLILLDVQLPIMNGFEVCKAIKQNSTIREIPILFLTGHFTGTEDITKGLGLGANDYIKKPFEIEELLARIDVMLRIKKQHDEMRELSITDELTGVYNRRILQHRLKENLSFAKRHCHPLSCMMIDLDHFKNVNDIHGHIYGDYVLKEVAEILKSFIRVEDLLVRYGGEEFLLIVYGSVKKAHSMGERLRKAIEQYRFCYEDIESNLTASIGVSTFLEYVTDTEEKLIALADSALYYAKYTGRNKVVCLPNEDFLSKKNVKKTKLAQVRS